MADGIILDYQPPLTMQMTFQQYWDSEVKDPPCRVRFTVSNRSPLSELTIVVDRLTEGSAFNADLDESWLLIASALKTLVEANRIMPLTDAEAAVLYNEDAKAEAAPAEAETAAAAP